MPKTLKEIRDHYDHYGITDIPTMDLPHYQQVLADGAFFWMDHHDFVRSTLSEEIFATNRKQLDALIAHLKQYRDKMPM